MYIAHAKQFRNSVHFISCVVCLCIHFSNVEVTQHALDHERQRVKRKWKKYTERERGQEKTSSRVM